MLGLARFQEENGEIMRPVLDPEAVREALEAVRTAKPLPPQHPFFSFLLLRHQVEDSAQLGGDAAVLHAVTEIFSDCLLAVLGSPTRHIPQEQIAEDFRNGNEFREMYSTVYYRYLCPQLDLSTAAIAEAAGVVERTVRRRLADGIDRLTQDVISREVAWRREQQQQVLALRLPYPADINLYGREGFATQVAASVGVGLPVLLYGLPGVGKSTLAAAVAHLLIPELDDLHWLALAPTQQIQTSLAQALGLPYDADENLQLYFAGRRVLLILDSITPRQFASLRGSFFQHASIIATTPQPFSASDCVMFEVPPMDENTARAFFLRVRGDLPASAADDALRMSGGSPGEILHYIQLRRFVGQVDIPAQLEARRHLHESWLAITPSARGAWLVAYWLGGLSLDSLQHHFGLGLPAIADMVNRYIFTLGQDERSHYWLTPEAAALATEITPQGVLLDSAIINLLEAPTADLITLLECGLLAYLSAELHPRVLDAAAAWVAELGFWEQWRSVLHNMETPSPYRACWRAVELARVERWLGQLAASTRRLHDLVKEAGEQGFFDLQARCYLELAQIALYRQSWAAVASYAEHAQTFYARPGYEAEHTRARLAAAAAAVYLAPDHVMHFLDADMIQNNARAAGIACESALQRGDLEQAIHFAHQTVASAPDSTSQHGRALGLLATAHQIAGQTRAALDYQQQAVNILTLTSDIIGLARAYNNLAVLYHGLNEKPRARDCWQTAFDMLLPLQDSAAMQVVRENMRYYID